MRSMTGFAQGRFEGKACSLSITIKSFNHRFMEVNVRGSGVTPQIEKWLKDQLKGNVFRGKVEMVFDLFEMDPQQWDIRLNEELLERILNRLRAVGGRSPENVDISMDSLLRLPMIFHLEHLDENFPAARKSFFQRSLNRVIRQFIKSRTTEGTTIRRDIKACIAEIDHHLGMVEQKAKEEEQTNFDKYRARIKKLLGDTRFDERRLAQEAAVLAEKLCVAEEASRLQAHSRRMIQLIKDKKVSTKGKELDFLAQEMQRETYTIAAKTNSADIHESILLIRREIEKIRQQVQNVE